MTRLERKCLFPKGSTGYRKWQWIYQRKPLSQKVISGWQYQCYCGAIDVWKYRSRFYCGNCGQEHKRFKTHNYNLKG